MFRDLRGLLAFVQVVESRSFSAAAIRLGVTKSAVSKLIQNLESELSVQLLVRTTRKLSLTEVGEHVYAACARLTEDLAAAQQAAATHRSVVAGHLRVTAPAVLGREYLVPLVTEFLAVHPGTTVELDLGDGYVDLVEQRIDVALRAGRSFADSSLVTRRIATVRLLVCASPRYLAKRGRPKTPTELSLHAWILHGHALESGRMTFRKGKSAVTVSPTGRFACNDGAATVAAAAAGHGVVIAPEFELGDHIARRKLVVVLEGWQLESLSLSAVLPPHRHVPTKVRAFVDLVAERWRIPPWAV